MLITKSEFPSIPKYFLISWPSTARSLFWDYRIIQEISMAEFVQTSTFGEEEIPLLLSENWTSDPDETDLKVKAMQESVDGQPLLLTKPLPPGKEYHLFMSYSSEDRMDANEIRDQLEERFQLKCLYYERDFQIGKNIDENITEGMQKSMKALILLSPFYLQSHYCVTEAREACKMSFTDFENLNVIPVVLAPLQKEMPAFLNSYVYIDAQKELDVAGKIYKAFNQPGIVFVYKCESADFLFSNFFILLKRFIYRKFRSIANEQIR